MTTKTLSDLQRIDEDLEKVQHRIGRLTTTYTAKAAVCECMRRVMAARVSLEDASQLLRACRVCRVCGETYEASSDHTCEDIIDIVHPSLVMGVIIAESELTESKFEELWQAMDPGVRDLLYTQQGNCSNWEFWKAYAEKVGRHEAGAVWFSAE